MINAIIFDRTRVSSQGMMLIGINNSRYKYSVPDDDRENKKKERENDRV